MASKPPEYEPAVPVDMEEKEKEVEVPSSGLLAPTHLSASQFSMEEAEEIDFSKYRRNELRALARERPDLKDQIAEALSSGKFKKTRFRKKSKKSGFQSEGSSEEEGFDFDLKKRTYYRSLRKDEDPYKDGLQPPKGFDPDKTIVDHVTAGSRARGKSAVISGTHSRRVAGAWASTMRGGGRVVRFRRPEEGDFEDLTDEARARELGLGDTAINAAKGSQEIVLKSDPPEDGVKPEYIEQVYDVKQVTAKEYNELKEEHLGKRLFKARSTAGKKAHRFFLTPRDRPNRSSPKPIPVVGSPLLSSKKRKPSRQKRKIQKSEEESPLIGNWSLDGSPMPPERAPKKKKKLLLSRRKGALQKPIDKASAKEEPSDMELSGGSDSDE